MTTDDKYSRRNMQNFTQKLEARLPQKQERFSGFFIAFLKCGFNLENIKEKISILASLFPELLTPKEEVT